MIGVQVTGRGNAVGLALLLAAVAISGCANMNDLNVPAVQPGSGPRSAAASVSRRHRPGLRERIVATLQQSYDRFDLAAVRARSARPVPTARRPVASQSTLDWLYPAAHLTLEPRPGREQADRDLARKMILRCIRQGQFRRPGHEADGIWFWNFHDGENPPPADRNTPGFMGCGLVRIWAFDPLKMADWPAGEFAEFKEAVRASVEAGERLPVRIGYANPQVLEFFLGFVAADLLGDPAIRDRTREHLAELPAVRRHDRYVRGVRLADVHGGEPDGRGAAGLVHEGHSRTRRSRSDLLGSDLAADRCRGARADARSCAGRTPAPTATPRSRKRTTCTPGCTWRRRRVHRAGGDGLPQGRLDAADPAATRRCTTACPPRGCTCRCGVPADVEQASSAIAFETPVESRASCWSGSAGAPGGRRTTCPSRTRRSPPRGSASRRATARAGSASAASTSRTPGCSGGACWPTGRMRRALRPA